MLYSIQCNNTNCTMILCNESENVFNCIQYTHNDNFPVVLLSFQLVSSQRTQVYTLMGIQQLVSLLW